MFSLQFSSFSQTPTLPNKPIDPFNIIIPHIYIGGIESLKTPDLFTLIVNCTRHIGIVPGKETIRVPVNDDPQESKALLASISSSHVLEKIHHMVLSKRNVLVHCHAGMQRSCTVVAMYLMKYHGINPYEAIRFIPTKRHIAFYPEPTFRQAINEYYALLGEEIKNK